MKTTAKPQVTGNFLTCPHRDSNNEVENSQCFDNIRVRAIFNHQLGLADDPDGLEASRSPT